MPKRAEFVLTDEEREAAEKHHNLIYSFMRDFSLNFDEWYDCVAIGYLLGVHKWYSEPAKQKYAISTVVYAYMRDRHNKAVKKKSALKRTGIVLSYDNTFTDEEETTYQKIMAISTHNPCEDVIADVTAQRLIHSIPQKDLELIQLLDRGFSQVEIGRMWGVTPQAVNRRLKKLRKKMEKELST